MVYDVILDCLYNWHTLSDDDLLSVSDIWEEKNKHIKLKHDVEANDKGLGGYQHQFKNIAAMVESISKKVIRYW